MLRNMINLVNKNLLNVASSIVRTSEGADDQARVKNFRIEFTVNVEQ